MVLELAHILLVLFELVKYKLGSATALAALQCNYGRLELREGLAIYIHAAVGLDLCGGDLLADRATAKLSLKTDSAKTCTAVLATMNLHTEAVREELTRLRLTEPPPASTAHAAAVPSLDGLSRVFNDQITTLLLQHANPTLDQRDARILVEDTVTLKPVVRSFAHEHLCLAKLHIRLGKDHWIRLLLSLANLVGARDGPISILVTDRFGSLLQHNVQELDA
mmetsp:Transcript_14388/g.31541  ORF Transcript_14388/g.31541 Transcript_14388/m.31541 type:complete len:222 (-) Transcript_14388:1795-2460(-)